MRTRRILFVIAVSIRTYMDKNVTRAAAALSYFLMLSVFPMFVCLYEMLGSMDVRGHGRSVRNREDMSMVDIDR